MLGPPEGRLHHPGALVRTAQRPRGDVSCGQAESSDGPAPAVLVAQLRQPQLDVIVARVVAEEHRCLQRLSRTPGRDRPDVGVELASGRVEPRARRVLDDRAPCRARRRRRRRAARRCPLRARRCARRGTGRNRSAPTRSAAPKRRAGPMLPRRSRPGPSPCCDSNPTRRRPICGLGVQLEARFRLLPDFTQTCAGSSGSVIVRMTNREAPLQARAEQPATRVWCRSRLPVPGSPHATADGDADDEDALDTPDLGDSCHGSSGPCRRVRIGRRPRERRRRQGDDELQRHRVGNAQRLGLQQRRRRRQGAHRLRRQATARRHSEVRLHRVRRAEVHHPPGERQRARRRADGPPVRRHLRRARTAHPDGQVLLRQPRRPEVAVLSVGALRRHLRRAHLGRAAVLPAAGADRGRERAQGRGSDRRPARHVQARHAARRGQEDVQDERRQPERARPRPAGCGQRQRVDPGARRPARRQGRQAHPRRPEERVSAAVLEEDHRRAGRIREDEELHRHLRLLRRQQPVRQEPGRRRAQLPVVSERARART